jgi:hypothetical protein
MVPIAPGTQAGPQVGPGLGLHILNPMQGLPLVIKNCYFVPKISEITLKKPTNKSLLLCFYQHFIEKMFLSAMQHFFGL